MKAEELEVAVLPYKSKGADSAEGIAYVTISAVNK